MEAVIADHEAALCRPRPVRPHVVYSANVAGRFRLGSTFMSAKLVLDGEEQYSGAFGRCSVVSGHFLLAAPNAVLDVDIKPGAKGFCAYFDANSIADMLRESLGEACAASPLAELASWTIALPVSASPFGRALEDCAVSGKALGHDDYCTLLAQCLAQLAARASRLSYRKASSQLDNLSRLERARAYMTERGQQHLTLQELAAAARMSPHRFVRVFSSAYGEPPLRYSQNLKLDMSRRRLMQGETVQQAADRAGFSSLSSFSRAYYRRHGRRPSEDAVKGKTGKGKISNLG